MKIIHNTKHFICKVPMQNLISVCISCQMREHDSIEDGIFAENQRSVFTRKEGNANEIRCSEAD